jgi:hypothetical protein
VAKAYKRLCDEHGDIVRKSFLDVGLSLPPDGSQDPFFPLKASSMEILLLGTLPKQYVKIPEIGENGEYILEDGKPLRQYSLLNNAQLRAALRARGIPGIGKKEKMIKCLMADDSTHQPGCFESGFEALYIHWDGSQMGSQKHKACWSLRLHRARLTCSP